MLIPFHIKLPTNLDTASTPPSPVTSPTVSDKKTNCSKFLHDYIKCIHEDERCCADLYDRYLKCDKVEQNK